MIDLPCGCAATGFIRSPDPAAAIADFGQKPSTLLQPIRGYIIGYPVSLALASDQSGMFEDLEVLGNSRGSDAESLRHLVHAQRPLLLQEFDDPDARLDAQYLE
jgi:hypothetical protein